jgi:predicted DNA-binding protein with PD1-like motif
MEQSGSRPPTPQAMRVLPIRLSPGQDLRQALEGALAPEHAQAGWVLSGIGSLSVARLRLAGHTEITTLQGDLEILSLAGSLSLDGAHLHISVARASGQVIGGHLATGSLVRTTAEVLLGHLMDWRFQRRLDPATGSPELQITRRRQTDTNDPFP